MCKGRESQSGKTFDCSNRAESFASGYGVPALAGGAMVWPGGLNVLPPSEYSHALPPEGGTPYPDAPDRAGSEVSLPYPLFLRLAGNFASMWSRAMAGKATGNHLFSGGRWRSVSGNLPE